MITTSFALESISDRKFGVPSRSYVLFDGKPTGLIVEGTILKRQYETYSGFLLWVTYEPPLDGALQIYLLSPAITVLDVRGIVGAAGYGSLKNLFKTGDDVFQFTFSGNDRRRLTVLKTPRFQIIRRAYDWGQSGMVRPFSPHHTAFFAYRYLELEQLTHHYM